jgi:hypothetical protein
VGGSSALRLSSWLAQGGGIDEMTDAIAIHSADIWVKMVEMLQQNWAVIEALDQRPHRMLALASHCVVLVRIKDSDRSPSSPAPAAPG